MMAIMFPPMIIRFARGNLNVGLCSVKNPTTKVRVLVSRNTNVSSSTIGGRWKSVALQRQTFRSRGSGASVKHCPSTGWANWSRRRGACRGLSSRSTPVSIGAATSQDFSTQSPVDPKDRLKLSRQTPKQSRQASRAATCFVTWPKMNSTRSSSSWKTFPKSCLVWRYFFFTFFVVFF